jgi:siroheme synthase-like protein
MPGSDGAGPEHAYYPVFLGLNGRPCTVVGGGQVALRKVATLLECGACVTVISPELCPELEELAHDGKITAVLRAYRAGDLKGAFVAIAATDDSAINAKAAREARAKRALVNVVDDASQSDFIAPAVIRRGDITIAISTSGHSPALARKLRTVLEQQFGNEYADLARLIGEVRAEVRQEKISVDAEGWQEALDLELLLQLLKEGEPQKARNILLGNLRAKQIRTETMQR